jgi:hypothetical protein
MLYMVIKKNFLGNGTHMLSRYVTILLKILHIQTDRRVSRTISKNANHVSYRWQCENATLYENVKQ